MDDDSEKKKAKGIKKCIIKVYHRNVYTEKVNKIVLSSNGDKRLQMFDKVTTYP